MALFDDRLEVTSPGMLDNEITIEKMISGLSKIRNKGIAAAFSYMNIIEAWGSGIPRMFREVEEYGLKEPELINLGSDFRVNLFRKETETDEYGVVRSENSALKIRRKMPNNYRVPKNNAELPEQEIIIVNYVRERKQITTVEAAELLGVKDRRGRSIVSSLTKRGILEKSGVTKNTVYLQGRYFEE